MNRNAKLEEKKLSSSMTFIKQTNKHEKREREREREMNSKDKRMNKKKK